jgi:hypothetical protein
VMHCVLSASCRSTRFGSRTSRAGWQKHLSRTKTRPSRPTCRDAAPAPWVFKRARNSTPACGVPRGLVIS